MPLTGSLKQLLLRGLLAGLVAGLVAGAVAFTLGEPHVAEAIRIEESAAPPESGTQPHSHDQADPAAHSHSDGDEPLVSRGGQQAGLFLGTALGGLAIGAIFGVAAHYLRRFTAMPGPRMALTLAAVGWLAVFAVPFFKYPANPPAVGDPDTISQRTWLWLAALVLGLLAAGLAGWVARIIATQRSWAIQATATSLTFIAVTAVGYLLLPAVNEVGDDFPATLLWQFRMSSLAAQSAMWLTLGLAFALLTERAERTPATERPEEDRIHMERRRS